METFTLDDDQVKKVNEWAKKFKWVPIGTIGGSYSISFTPTSLGVVVKVKNNANNQELDVTDYDSW